MQPPTGDNEVRKWIQERKVGPEPKDEKILALSKVTPTADGEDAVPTPHSNLWTEVNDLKNGKETAASAMVPTQTGEDRANAIKYNTGIFGQLAKNKVFEGVTIFVILLNAIGIGWDADYSARFEKDDNLFEGPVYFAVMECFFCTYFTFEILIRFFAYRIIWHCLIDAWFVFDSVLVAMMIIETLVLPFVGSGGPLAQLSILRLLRLLRITRMAKLMRAFPQLMMIVKGIAAATRAVVWTFILLLIISFAWAILFTNEYHQGHLTDAEVKALEEDDPDLIMELFGSMGKSMLSLLVMGTILDDITACTNQIRATENMWMLLAFILYVLLNSFMMMNMLVGILVEVVGNTADGEKARMAEDHVKETMFNIFQSMDKDGSGIVSREEFMEMKRDKKVMTSLEELEIQDQQFDKYVELLFKPDDTGDIPSLSHARLLECMCQLRPGTSVSALDFASFKESLENSQDVLKHKLDQIDHVCEELNDQDEKFKNSENANGGDETARHENRPAAPKRISSHMLQRLECTSSSDIVSELQRRLGSANLEETGVPLMMMDEDLQNRVKSIAAFQTPGMQRPALECSREAVTC